MSESAAGPDGNAEHEQHKLRYFPQGIFWGRDRELGKVLWGNVVRGCLGSCAPPWTTPQPEPRAEQTSLEKTFLVALERRNSSSSPRRISKLP